MQFSNTKLQEFRVKLAVEIARQAAAYDGLVKQLISNESTLKTFHNAQDNHLKEIKDLKTAWANERQTYGLKEDFSDFDSKNWPK